MNRAAAGQVVSAMEAALPHIDAARAALNSLQAHVRAAAQGYDYELFAEWSNGELVRTQARIGRVLKHFKDKVLYEDSAS